MLSRLREDQRVSIAIFSRGCPPHPPDRWINKSRRMRLYTNERDSKKERDREGSRRGVRMRRGKEVLRGGCQGKSHAIFPCVGTTMMRFRKGQWHPSVGSVFSGSVSPPPSSWSVNPCHSHLPSLMMRGLGGPKVGVSHLGFGSLDPAV